LFVLDYKTGSFDKLPKRPLVFSDEINRQEIFENIRSFQLPLYMYFMFEAFPGKQVNAGFYSLKEADISAIFTDKFPPQEGAVFLRPFLTALNVIMTEILDPQKLFVDDELRLFLT
jgi:hypothetical protein